MADNEHPAHLTARRRWPPVAALLAATGVLVVAVSGSDGETTVAIGGEAASAEGAGDADRVEAGDRSTTTMAPTTATTATTTTAPPVATLPPLTTTTAPPDPAADGTLELGEGGPTVLALQQRLSGLGYWLGEPDGNYGQLTRQAVMAFQKAEGLGRDGVAGPQTQQRLAVAGRPAGRSGAGNVIEIDLTRQVLLVIEGGQVRYALNTSTGSGEAYASSTGGSAIAATPPGHYTITRRIDGVREAPLGTLYRPMYFNGGIAIHGSGSIPAFPASHGCARLTNAAADLLWGSGLAELGTPVWVY